MENNYELNQEEFNCIYTEKLKTDDLYIKKPINFVRNTNLTDGEYKLYDVLRTFGVTKDYGTPSVETLSNLLGKQPRQTRNLLKALEKKGAILVISQYKKENKSQITNLYFLATINKKTGEFEKEYIDRVMAMYPNKKRFI